MIAAQYTQPGKFAIADAALPTIGDDELLLRVQATVLCGTDVKIVRHGHRKLRDGQTITLGHEFTGTIEKVGTRISGYQAGQAVGVAPNIGCGRCEMCTQGLGNLCPDYQAFGITFDGSHAEFVRIPGEAIRQGNVIPLPAGVSFAEAALSEPLSCVINAQRQTRIEIGDTVLVYGAGAMGLLHIMLAAINGAGRVIAADLASTRLEQAHRIGATDTILSSTQRVPDWVAAQTGGRGVDVVIIAVPVPALQTEALKILAPYGRLCLFAGWAKGVEGVTLDTNPIHYRSLTVTGSTGGSVRDYAAALRLIAGQRLPVGKIISDCFDFHHIQEAYDAAMTGERMKVLITPSGHTSAKA